MAVFLTMVSLVGAVACSSTGPSAGSNSPTAGSQVVVKIYSGRENPTWKLDSAASASLVTALDAMTALGFQGFDVSNLGTIHGSAAMANISAHEVILTLGNSNTITLDDPSSSAITVLLADARRHLAADLLKTMQQQLKQGEA